MKLIIAVTLLFSSFISAVQSEEMPANLRINLVEEAEWPPFTYEKSGLATTGLSKDLMAAIFEPLGVNVAIDLLPQKRMLRKLESGLADGATVISKNTDRQKYLVFSDPLLSKLGKIYFAKDKLKSFEWHDFQDLKRLNIGIVRGHNYGDDFSYAIKKHQLKVNEVSNIEQLFQMLKVGRVDLIMANEWTAIHFQSRPEYKGLFEAAEKPYYKKGYHIGLSNKSPFVKHLPSINRRIQELERDGSIKALIDKHFTN